MLKKKIIRLILASLFIFLLYIGLNIFQSKNIEIIAFEDISELKVTETNPISEDTTISGIADVGLFESVAMSNRIVVEDTLYLIIYKWPTFLSDHEIEFNLKNVGGLSKVNKISIVWGDIYQGEGNQEGFYYNDLEDHSDQQIIWKKTEGVIE